MTTPATEPYEGPLCGDADCGGCPTQADLDAHYQREWDAAGELVYGALGLTYPATKDRSVALGDPS